MNPSVFHQNLRSAQERLAREERRGFWVRLFTLGLFGNHRRIAEAKHELEKCREHLAEYERLREEARELDNLLSQTIELQGVRVSKHVFADIPVLGAVDYGVGWEQLRDIVLTRDHYECQEGNGYCQGPLQIHHATPLSKGGTNDLDNLLTLCHYHHAQRHEHMRGRFHGNLWR